MPLQAAAAQISWQVVLKYLPVVADGARILWDKWNSKSKTPFVDTKAEPKTQIATIVERLEALEASEVDQANLFKQIAEQLQGMSAGLNEVSHRSSIGLWLGIGALAMSIIALVLVALR